MGSGYTTGAESVRFGAANTHGMVNITYGTTVLALLLPFYRYYICVLELGTYPNDSTVSFCNNKLPYRDGTYHLY